MPKKGNIKVLFEAEDVQPELTSSLCSKCNGIFSVSTILKTQFVTKVAHHSDENSLRAAAASGCQMCASLCGELDISRRQGSFPLGMSLKCSSNWVGVQKGLKALSVDSEWDIVSLLATSDAGSDSVEARFRVDGFTQSCVLSSFLIQSRKSQIIANDTFQSGNQ
jgi:hypothetical protein